MKRIGCCLPLALLCTSFLLAQEFSEVLPQRREFSTQIEVIVHKPISFKIDAKLKDGWLTTDKITAFKQNLFVPPQVSYLKQSDGTFYCWAPVGSYTIISEATLINWTRQDIDERNASISLTVKSSSPLPPDPTPDPPTPDADNPFPLPGLRVLLIEEQTERGNIPKEQLAIFGSGEVRAYLNAKCPKDSSGNPEWHIYDKDQEFNSDNMWKKALLLPRTSSWWVIISNGSKWESTPLPSNIPDMMTLLRKYGGQ